MKHVNSFLVITAVRIRDEIITRVKRGDFVAVCDGVNGDILDGFKSTDDVPPINHQPRGPHPIGSFETWVPKEYFSEVMSFFMQRRNKMSIMIHPLTRYEVVDHTQRVMWLGPSLPLDVSVLTEDIGEAPLQYPELGLGYSRASTKDLFVDEVTKFYLKGRE